MSGGEVKTNRQMHEDFSQMRGKHHKDVSSEGHHWRCLTHFGLGNVINLLG